MLQQAKQSNDTEGDESAADKAGAALGYAGSAGDGLSLTTPSAFQGPAKGAKLAAQAFSAAGETISKTSAVAATGLDSVRSALSFANGNNADGAFHAIDAAADVAFMAGGIPGGILGLAYTGLGGSKGLATNPAPTGLLMNNMAIACGMGY